MRPYYKSQKGQTRRRESGEFQRSKLVVNGKFMVTISLSHSLFIYHYDGVSRVLNLVSQRYLEGYKTGDAVVKSLRRGNRDDRANFFI